MNKLIPFTKFSKKSGELTKASVVVNEGGLPLGFVFGRDSFISFLQFIDDEFEKRAEDPKKAYSNPAGRLIDLIEERLPLNPKFVKDLKTSISKTNKSDWMSLEKVTSYLNV